MMTMDEQEHERPRKPEEDEDEGRKEGKKKANIVKVQNHGSAAV
jgi:hypothetical protein